MKTFSFIFARGGSKGVPNKNLREVAGRSLLARSVELALSHPSIDDCFVSTDSEDIANLAKSLGANVIERPSELATDNSPEWLAWQHAVQYLLESGEMFDRFVSLPTTAPLRRKEDITNCLEKLTQETDIAITVCESSRSPWFNQIKIGSDGLATLVNAGSGIFRRQDAPAVYDITPLAYVTTPSHILNHSGLWDGRVGVAIVPKERAIDIDSEFDLRVAELLLKYYPFET